MVGQMLENVRKSSPVVHCITNYVTANDCANILIAAGASPIMSDDTGEVEEIVSISGALVINIGTLSSRTIPAMFLAGRKANELKVPVILDPVGAGASKLRTETAKRLLDEVRFTAIRGNASEVKALALGSATTRGVDADAGDAVTASTLDDALSLARSFSKRTGAVVAISGETDVAALGDRAFLVKNGHPMMSKITGSGCMLSALVGAFVAANWETPLEAVAAALCTMGLGGEIAYGRMKERKTGNSTYRNDLIDAVFALDGGRLDSGARYESR